MKERKLRGLDLFSGIGVASMAMEDAGIEVVAHSEIEPLPCAVLERRFPGVPNLGDIAEIKAREVEKRFGRVDVISGGWPCQDLSVAGKRAGLAGARSNLFWHVVRLADELRPAWLVLENVPGVFSSWSPTQPPPHTLPTADFDTKDDALRWADSLQGSWDVDERNDFDTVLWAIKTLGYGVAWRVLDAQYFGVPQRRRRVFLVGYLGGPCPPEVLFESEGVPGDPAPGREARQSVAALTAGGVGTCGADDNQAQAGHLLAFGGNDTRGPIDVAAALNAHGGSHGRLDFESETFLVEESSGFRESGQGFWMEGIGPLRRSEGGGEYSQLAISPDASGAEPGDERSVLPLQDGRSAAGEQNGLGVGAAGDPSYTLDSTGRQAIAFSCKDDGRDATEEMAPTLRSMGYDKSHANGGGQLAVAFKPKEGDEPKREAPIPILEAGARTNSDGYRDGDGLDEPGAPMFTLQARHQHAVAIAENQRGEMRTSEKAPALSCGGGKPGAGYTAVAFKARYARNGRGAPSDLVPPLKAESGQTGKGDAAALVAFHTTQDPISGEESPCLSEGNQQGVSSTGAQAGMAVRRLTPVECERLQGLPDGWTDVPYGKIIGGKRTPAADGLRYRALGNAWARPVGSWVLRRLALVARGERP